MRCAAIAMAFSPTTSRGRPGVWTSPAEIMVVTPPCRVESIQFIWLCRGVQSPATGWTWLSMRPGTTSAQPWASITVRAPSASRFFSAPDPGNTAVDDQDRVGIEDRGEAMSPDSMSPMLRISTLPEAAGGGQRHGP